MNTPLNRTGPFICPKCGKQFKYSRGRSAACLVFHPPGSCCHHNQYEVTDLVATDTEPPRSQTNPPKSTQSDKELEQILDTFDKDMCSSQGSDTPVSDQRRDKHKAIAALTHLIAEETNTAYERGYSVQLRKDNDFIKHIQTEEIIKELTRLDNAYDEVTPENFHEYYINRLASLKANKGKSCQ